MTQLEMRFEPQDFERRRWKYQRVYKTTDNVVTYVFSIPTTWQRAKQDVEDANIAKDRLDSPAYKDWYWRLIQEYEE